jgi:WD40 repeat protein
LEGHDDRVRAVAFSPSAKLLATGGEDRMIKLWSTDTWTLVKALPGHRAGVCSLAFLDEDFLVSASGEFLQSPENRPTELFLWDLAEEGEPKNLVTDSPPFALAAFDVQRRLAATAGKDKIIRLWKLPSGTLLHEFQGHAKDLWSLSFSPDGSELVSVSATADDDRLALESGSGGQGELRVWDLGQRKQRLLLRAHPVYATGAAFCAGGSELLSVGIDGSVHNWWAREHVPRAALPIGKGEVRAIAVSPQGDLLAASCAVDPEADNLSGQITLWNLQTGQLARQWDAHAAQIECLVFSSDGLQLASGGQDKRVAVWDPADGGLLHEFQGHTDMVTGLGFFDNDQGLASSSADKTIRLWS